MRQLLDVIGFDWDTNNDRKSADKHGVTKLDAEEVFFNQPLLVLDDVKHSENELRLHAMGQTDEARLLHITFTIRASKIRVISARDMHKKERILYEKNT